MRYYLEQIIDDIAVFEVDEDNIDGNFSDEVMYINISRDRQAAVDRYYYSLEYVPAASDGWYVESDEGKKYIKYKILIDETIHKKQIVNKLYNELVYEVKLWDKLLGEAEICDPNVKNNKICKSSIRVFNSLDKNIDIQYISTEIAKINPQYSENDIQLFSANTIITKLKSLDGIGLYKLSVILYCLSGHRFFIYNESLYQLLCRLNIIKDKDSDDIVRYFRYNHFIREKIKGYFPEISNKKDFWDNDIVKKVYSVENMQKVENITFLNFFMEE